MIWSFKWPYLALVLRLFFCLYNDPAIAEFSRYCWRTSIASLRHCDKWGKSSGVESWNQTMYALHTCDQYDMSRMNVGEPVLLNIITNAFELEVAFFQVRGRLNQRVTLPNGNGEWLQIWVQYLERWYLFAISYFSLETKVVLML